MPNRKIILCILDGLGIPESYTDNTWNAFTQSNSPFLKQALQDHPMVKLDACEGAVGLIEGQMGNSEVGHMTIGSGRIIEQSLTRIHKSVETNTLFKTKAIQNLIKYLQKHPNTNCHIIGLLSDGGVHSHINHIIHIANGLADIRHTGKIYLHIITDGRDTSPKCVEKYINMLFDRVENCEIASISGRYYAMDRDNRKERTTLAYDAIALGKGKHSFHSNRNSINQFILNSYEENIMDEFFMPSSSLDYQGMQNEDAVIFCNFRADRMRQITQMIATSGPIISMYPYFEDDSRIIPIFTQNKTINTIGEVLAIHGKKQMRIAETEKYPHVTFFLNCGSEKPYEGEDRIMIPSPKISTYDLQPEMSAYGVTDTVVQAIEQQYDFICVNFANTDMVGHTGVMSAAIKACEVVDECVAKICNTAMRHNVDVLITADHGNIENMFDDITHQPHTAHTMNKVPFICISNDAVKVVANKEYKYGLYDVAPTVLSLLDIKIPAEMTGRSLFKIR